MNLRPEYLPATGGAQQQLVLLHGWGSDRDVWRPLLAALRPWANITLLDLPGCAPGLELPEEPRMADLLEAILAASPGRAVYLGWSLGGQLAAQLAASCPQRVAALVTVCSNPRFIGTPDWPGMAGEVFTQFRAGCHSDPGQTLRRFGSLQVQGAQQPRQLLRQWQGARQRKPGGALATGLAWLEQLDQRELLRQLQLPQLHLLAGDDALVPPVLAPALRALLAENSAARVSLLPRGSHLAPLDNTAAIAAETRQFLAAANLLQAGPAEHTAPAKKDVASSFSRAATRYDSVAKLQRDVGRALLDRLDNLAAAPCTVLDLGCGTGFFQPELNARFPGSRYIGLDLASGMIDYARTRAVGDCSWLVGDAESLPLACDSVDLIFSSLAIQWCHRADLLFAELARVLRPGGRCVFSSLGPLTLRELRQSWAAVDAHQHVNTFLAPEVLAEAASAAPGIELALSGAQFSMHYSRVGELLAELKTLGAHNMNHGRPAGLNGRKSLQGMLQAYEQWRVDGMLPASYDVIFGQVEKQ